MKPLRLVAVLAACGLQATAAQAAELREGCNAAALQPAVQAHAGAWATTLQTAAWDDQPQPHCRITGIIGAHTGAPGRTAYGNRFLLRVPQGWNGRLLFQGGGGNNGVVGDALGLVKDGRTALSQGWAVIAQDSGHQGREPHFALDPQAYTDFAHAGVHKATVVGKELLAALTGSAPQRSYFMGCSNGGREALATAQRYSDFDGVIAGAPGLAVYDQWLQVLSLLQRVARVAGVPADGLPQDTSGVISDAQLQTVAAHFQRKCDPLDGLADGIVSHPMACRAEAADWAVLRCQGAADAAGATCLSEAQAGLLQHAYDGARDSRGRLIWPGFIPGHIEGVMRPGYLGQAGTASTVGSFYASVMANFPYMGYGLHGYPRLKGPADALASYPADTRPDVMAFDFDRDPPLLAAGRRDFHADEPARFEAFRRRGGRMLLYSGSADPGVQLPGITGFMDRLASHHGRVAADAMAALFIVPGMQHCRGGETTDAFDPLAALVAWVEQGQRPERLIARPAPNTTLARTRAGLTRPLCAYPRHARYAGSGNPDLAENFVCAAP